MNELLLKMSEVLAQNFWLGLIIVFAAGVLTVFTPCSLSSIPLIVAYVSGTGSTKKKAFLYSVFICIGQTAVFIAMGLIAASLGRLMGIGGFGRIWNVILAALMVWMALEIFGVTNVLSKGGSAVSKVTRKGILGAVLVGMLSALFATPCSTPILMAMLAYVSSAQLGLLAGGALLLSYSLGHSILLVILGTSVGFVQTLSGSSKYAKAYSLVKIILGILMLAMAAYFVIISFY